MHKSARTAVVFWSVLLLGGCTTIAGLDGIREESCAPLCGHDAGRWVEGGGVVIEAAAPIDVSAPPVIDAAPSEAAAPTDAPSTTTTPEASCGPTNTIENCGACGQTCAPVSVSTTSASCSGTACTYTCGTDTIDNGHVRVPAYLDCNAAAGYDPDGCECAATETKMPIACCGSSCPTQHDVGLSGSGYPAERYFYDCNPVGTYSAELAMEACLNFEGGPNYGQKCFKANCSSGGAVVCGQDGTLCACWEYTGPNVGEVAVPKTGAPSPDGCYCPGNNDAVSTDWQ